MPASADEENRSATADPLARTVADVLVRNALPGEIDRLDKDRLHAIAAFAAAAIAERPPGKPVVQVASGAESDGKRTSWVLVNTDDMRSEEHTSELQSLMRISYAVFCLKKKKKK